MDLKQKSDREDHKQNESAHKNSERLVLHPKSMQLVCNKTGHKLQVKSILGGSTTPGEAATKFKTSEAHCAFIHIGFPN